MVRAFLSRKTNTVGSVSTDRLVFDSDKTSNLNNFDFTGFAPGAVEFAPGGGFFEIAPCAGTLDVVRCCVRRGDHCFSIAPSNTGRELEIYSLPNELNTKVDSLIPSRFEIQFGHWTRQNGSNTPRSDGFCSFADAVFGLAKPVTGSTIRWGPRAEKGDFC